MGTYRQLWSARLALIRPGNGLMAAVGVLTGVLIIDPVELATGGIAAAMAAFMITSFGNVLNDVTDVELDKQAHPDRPLASGQISVPAAKAFAVALVIFGIWQAYLAAGKPTLIFAMANVLLLFAYETRLKKLGLPGNIIVAGLVASSFLFGALTVSTDWRSWGPVMALAVMAFLANLARELLKDCEDLAADAGIRQTFPMLAGTGNTWALATFLVAVAVSLSGVTWYFLPWPPLWGLLLVAAALGFGYGCVIARSDAHRGQKALKFAMLVALAAFIAGAVA